MIGVMSSIKSLVSSTTSSVLMHPAILEITINTVTSSDLVATLFIMGLPLAINYLIYVNNYILENYYYP